MYTPKYAVGDFLLVEDRRWNKSREQESYIWIAEVLEILFEDGWSGKSAYKVINVGTDDFYPRNSSHAADVFDPMVTKIENVELALSLYGKKETKT